MIERIYVHNFRCLENFTLDLSGLGSALVIGKNGAGKSTLRHALGIFQSICRGPNRAKAWIEASDFTFHRRHIPMRFEIDVTLSGKLCKYAIAFEMPETFHEPRVAEESLVVEGANIFSRRLAQIDQTDGPTFGLDWHVAALPVINVRIGQSFIQQVKSFFASSILLAPVPSAMSGFSEEESSEVVENASNFSAWLNALLVRQPSSYSLIDSYLRSVMPDFELFQNADRGETGKQLQVRFKAKGGGNSLSLEFKKLSDGEKCFFLSAVVVAYNKANGPVFCMWDEPDNHLALPEVSHFITELRRLSNRDGQFIATSHHPEVIRQFSDENTFVLIRNSHLEPTVVRPLTAFPYQGSLVEALIRNEVIG